MKLFLSWEIGVAAAHAERDRYQPKQLILSILAQDLAQILAKVPLEVKTFSRDNAVIIEMFLPRFCGLTPKRSFPLLVIHIVLTKWHHYYFQ